MLAVIRLIITLFFSNNRAIVKIIKKDVPDTPMIGSNPHKLSNKIPRFSQGKPEITQDLNHSSKKKILGIIRILNLWSLKNLIAAKNIPK